MMETQTSRSTPTGLHAGAPRSTLPDAARIQSIYGLVDTEMQAAEGELHHLVRSSVPAVTAIGQYLSKAGGKRLRPLITALGARAAGNQGDITRLMCAGELLHLGSLLHDDVVDGGQERRGQAAAQNVFGNAAVILTGDHCFARACTIAAEEAGLQAVTEMARTVSEMSEGEVQQLLNAGNLDLPLAEYLEVIQKKSASLVSWCAAAGAWAIDDAQAVKALHAYGQSVGIAFQITDDVLDYTGKKHQTGKRRGRDLAERKLTLPLLLAMQRMPELADRLRTGNPSPERIPSMLSDVIASGATDDALAFARERIVEGVAALQALPKSPYRDALEDLAVYVVERIA